MDIGAFDKLVSYQRRGTARDEHGQSIDSWVEVCKRWTNIRNQSGAEAIRAGATTSLVQCSLRVLNCPQTVDNGMRGVYRGKVYKILSVLPDEVAQAHVDLVCEAVT
jgi:SPP1 family predicted phage head-tail adaptor